jgi:hypothetical protein
MRLRCSIASLLAVILVCGIGLAALHEATLLWASALFTLAMGLLRAASLFSIVGGGRRRATWAGFAIFGWIYVLTTFWGWPAPNGVTAPPYLTKVLIDDYRPAQNNASVTWIDYGPQGETSPDPATISFRPPSGRAVNRLHFRRIGHTLAAILCGIVGAVLGRSFAAAERREDDTSSPSGVTRRPEREAER